MQSLQPLQRDAAAAQQQQQPRTGQPAAQETYSQQFSQHPRPVMPANQQGQGQIPGPPPYAQDEGTLGRTRDEKPNPFLGAYRDPYAPAPTPPMPGEAFRPTPPGSERTSLEVPGTLDRPRSAGSSSSGSSRSRSPSPDPTHAQGDPRYQSEFAAAKQAWGRGPAPSAQVPGAPEVRTTEGQAIEYVILPNGLIEVPSRKPCLMYCPKDREWVTTEIGRRSGLVTVVSAGALLFVAWPLAWLPFVFKKSGKDWVHKCPKCHLDLAVIPRHLA
ncbi:hypothetical protein DFJ74DRAFT_706962 [Hyaloraphidium curvatum]|nr:hypothetical protein DFJ74DRAFT_706962 [Hyaloraphidium curvatum]